MAEPNLIALSGDHAEFLAGGEFPVPVASTTQGGVPTITIEFKKFGVQLRFRPTVLSRGIINLKIEPEVSELDFSNAVAISGTVIPALTKRNATTTVELRDGQSFAVAGLIDLSKHQYDCAASVDWFCARPRSFVSQFVLSTERDRPRHYRDTTARCAGGAGSATRFAARACGFPQMMSTFS